MKKKTLMPLIIFLLGICLVGFIVYKTDTHEKNERHITAQLNATTYVERIKNEIASGHQSERFTQSNLHSALLHKIMQV